MQEKHTNLTQADACIIKKYSTDYVHILHDQYHNQEPVTDEHVQTVRIHFQAMWEKPRLRALSTQHIFYFIPLSRTRHSDTITLVYPCAVQRSSDKNDIISRGHFELKRTYLRKHISALIRSNMCFAMSHICDSKTTYFKLHNHVALSHICALQ